ncbi:MAG: hypothetical protein U1E65_29230 [Myxococcota bacterium]
MTNRFRADLTTDLVLDVTAPKEPRPSAAPVGWGSAVPSRVQEPEVSSDERTPTGHAVAAWLSSFERAVASARLYPALNPTREQHLDQCWGALQGLLQQQAELTLGVREGRLHFGRELVHAGGEDSLPAALWGASISRISFQRGISREEVERLLCALASSGRGQRRSGEDLGTDLWRLELPHLRYQTFDVFSVMSASSLRRTPFLAEMIDDAETKRLKAEIAAVVRAFSREAAGAMDRLRMQEEAIETPDAALAAYLDPAERARSLHASERRVELERFKKELVARNGHEAISVRAVSLLIEAQLAEERPEDPTPALELLLQLFHEMMEQARFDDATRVVQQLRAIAAQATTRGPLDFARRLLGRFSCDAYVGRAVAALDHPGRPTLSHHAMLLLEALAEEAGPSLLARLGEVEDPEARRTLCQLVLRATVHDRAPLIRAMLSARFEVALTVLELSQAEPEEDRRQLLEIGLRHPHPKARAETIRQLERAEEALSGFADESAVRALNDPDALVRMAGLRALARRRPAVGGAAARNHLRRTDVAELDRRELVLATTTLAALIGDRAIPDLERLLEDGGSVFRPRPIDVQIAAGIGLLAVGSAEAKQIVERGARSLAFRLRAACQEALKHPRSTGTPRPSLERSSEPPAPSTSDLLPRPVAPLVATQEPIISRTIRERIQLLSSATPRPSVAPASPSRGAGLTPLPRLAEPPPPRLPSNALIPLPAEEEER